MVAKSFSRTIANGVVFLARNKVGKSLLHVMAKAIVPALRLAPAGRSSPPGSPDSIGVWKRDDAGNWKRDPAKYPEWRCWADRPTIPGNPGAKTRVLLIGESAARGYFYDPAMTPAQCLEKILDCAEPGAFEVVDLARIDIDQFGILDIIEKSAALGPHIVVFWGGNNWLHFGEYRGSHVSRILSGREDIYDRSRGIFLSEILPATTARLMEGLSRLEAASGARTIVVIPEWNLVDWEDECSASLPFLKDDCHTEWSALLETAEGYLAEGRYDECHATAKRMSTLDRGLGARSLRLIGLSLLGKGNMEDAREYLEKARDALAGIPIPTAPRCPAAAQQALRNEAVRRGMEVVDQVELFTDGTGKPPDGSVFMDYCHLGKEAIFTTSKAIASRICRKEGKPAQAIKEWTGSGMIRPEDEAMAHVMAAMHNAHYGQGYAQVLRHCRRAVELDVNIGAIFRLMLDFMSRRANRWLCGSFAELSRNRIANRYLHPRNPNEWDKFEDSLLSRALVEADGSGELESHLRELLVVEHFRPGAPVDLLEFQYQARTFRSRGGFSLGPVPAYHRAFARNSDLILVSNGKNSVGIRITCRIQGEIQPGESLAILVNGIVHSTHQVGRNWFSLDLVVDASALRRGGNVIRIRWPGQRFPWRLHLQDLRRCLARGEMPTSLPVHGEIHQCTADARRGHRVEQ